MRRATDRQTDRHTDTKTAVANIHFASVMSHAKCNNHNNYIHISIPPYKIVTSQAASRRQAVHVLFSLHSSQCSAQCNYCSLRRTCCDRDRITTQQQQPPTHQVNSGFQKSVVELLAGRKTKQKKRKKKERRKNKPQHENIYGLPIT